MLGPVRLPRVVLGERARSKTINVVGGLGGQGRDDSATSWVSVPHDVVETSRWPVAVTPGDAVVLGDAVPLGVEPTPRAASVSGLVALVRRFWGWV